MIKTQTLKVYLKYKQREFTGVNKDSKTTKCVIHSLKGHPSRHPPATWKTVEGCNWYYFIYHQSQLNVTLTSLFTERHWQFQTKKTKLKLVTSSRLKKKKVPSLRLLKLSFPSDLLSVAPRTVTLEAGRAYVKSRGMAARRGLENLKYPSSQACPGCSRPLTGHSGVREELKILDSCE